MTRLLTIILIIYLTNSFSQKIAYTDISNNITPISIGLDKEIQIEIDKDARLIICGEVHNVPINKILKFQFLRHTYINNDVRYLIVETGPAMSYVLNKYLITGDESLLNFSEYFLNEIDFWKALKDFNKTVDLDNQIKVIGFDFDWIKPYRYTLNELLNTRAEYKLSTQNKIQKILDRVNTNLRDEDIRSINIDIQMLLNSNDALFLSDISANKTTLELIAWNEVPYTGKTKRDKETYKNISRFATHFNNGNFFGQYGISHVNKALPTLTKMLHENSDSPFKGQVVSISPQYINCETKWADKIKSVDGFGILTTSKVKYSDLQKITNDVTILETRNLINIDKRLHSSTDYIIFIMNQRVE